MGRFSDWLKTNRGIGTLFLLAVAVLFVYFLRSDWFYRPSADGFPLGFMPAASAIFLAVNSLILILDSHRRETPDDLRGTSLILLLLVLGMVAWWGATFRLMLELGFLVMGPVFVSASCYALGFRPWWQCIIIGVVMAGILYVMFDLIMNIPLPKGVLQRILPF